MERTEIFNAITALVGSKLVFDEQWDGKVSVGEDRPVCAITKKYIYLGCDCYAIPYWENDMILVNEIQRIPITMPMYGKITNKVELSGLSTEDLESVYNGVMEYFKWQISRIPELSKELEKTLKLKAKYNKVIIKK